MMRFKRYWSYPVAKVKNVCNDTEIKFLGMFFIDDIDGEEMFGYYDCYEDNARWVSVAVREELDEDTEIGTICDDEEDEDEMLVFFADEGIEDKGVWEYRIMSKIRTDCEIKEE